jgi:hypothetical protein
MNKQIFITLVFLLFAIVCNPQNSFAQLTPNEINARTFMLSNEAPGYLIDNLIAAGYGDSSLYAVMQYLQPLSGGVIPQWFMDSLAVCPAGSDVFTAELFNFSDPSNNPAGISEEGSVIISGIYGKDYSVMEGYTTFNDTLVPVSLKLFTKAIGPEFYIDAGTRTVYNSSVPVTTHYKAFAIAWSLGSTIVLSNEAPGSLIDKLIAAGHGSKNLYQVLQFLSAQPGSSIPKDFVTRLGSAPNGSDVKSVPLTTFAHIENNPVCINSDGSAHIASIYGKNYYKNAGYLTNSINYPGIAPVNFTHATSKNFYINAGTGSGIQSYEAFGIVWATEAPTTFVLTNEGGLIDDLIRAGHGTKNLYQVLQLLKPKSGGVITEEFMATLAKCPAGSEIFTANLKSYTGINNPVCINTDGTIRINDIFGKDYLVNDGYTTLPLNQNGYTSELFTVPNSAENYIDAGSSGTSGGTAINYKAFAIAWKASSTFVLTNEGGLIDDLVRAGHDTKNLYQTLEVLKPKSGGVISDEFMATLANCPEGSEIFTLELNNFSVNWPVAINTDGRVFVTPIYGKDYFRKDGYTTLPLNQNGYTSELYTVANSAENYIDAGQAAEGSPTIYYKAFAIAWSEPATITVNPAVLNIGGSNGSTATFTITSNDGWTITPGRGWLAAIPVSGTGNATVTLTAQANPQTTERTDTLKISATGGEPQIVVVTQSINTGVNTLNEKEFEIYPNPTNGKFRVQSLEFKVHSLEVVDLNGKVLENFELLPETGNPEFDIGHLKPGVYFIRLCNHNQTVIGKVVKL